MANGGRASRAEPSPCVNPATEEEIGTVAHADRADLDEALEAAAKGFKVWRAVAPFERCRIMRKAAADHARAQ